MNKLFLAFIFAFVHGCWSVGIAQTTPNTQTYFQNLPTPVNLIKNPDARLNALDVQKTGTVVVTATAATGNSPTYFSIGAISTLGYAEFDLRPVKSDMTSGQCEFKGKYFGTEASKYSARIFNGTTEVIKVVLKNTTSDLASGGPWGEFSVGAPCSSNPKVRIYADAVGLSLNVNRLYYDKATNIGSYTPPTGFSARMSSTGVVSQKEAYFQTPCTKNSAGNWTCNYVVGKLSSNPYCVVTPDYNAALGVPSITAQSNTAISFVTPSVDVGVNIICDKTGADAPQTVVRPETPRTPNIVRYTSGSGTYTPTPGTKYIIVEMVGGGGGGSSGGSTAGTAATSGSSTTFGTSLLTANGGSFGVGLGVGGAGGGATINSPAVGQSSSGGSGTAHMGVQAGLAIAGSPGGNSCFGGGGGGGPYASTGAAGAASTGSGGGGGGGGTSANGGSGGGAGGCIKAMITSPSSSYPYSVGTGGNAGTGGTGGNAGGAGGSGIIIITEYFSSDVNAIIATNDLTPVDAFLSSQATTAGTLQKLNIVATVNSNGLFSGGTFTAKDKCNYLVNAGADIGPFSTGPGAFVQTVLAIYKNGGEFRRRNGSTSNVPSVSSISAIVPLNSGEYLELYGNPGTGNGNGMANISMQVIKLPNCN